MGNDRQHNPDKPASPPPDIQNAPEPPITEDDFNDPPNNPDKPASPPPDIPNAPEPPITEDDF